MTPDQVERYIHEWTRLQNIDARPGKGLPNGFADACIGTINENGYTFEFENELDEWLLEVAEMDYKEYFRGEEV